MALGMGDSYNNNNQNVTDDKLKHNFYSVFSKSTVSKKDSILRGY